jgi:hypothetical protein
MLVVTVIPRTYQCLEEALVGPRLVCAQHQVDLARRHAATAGVELRQRLVIGHCHISMVSSNRHAALNYFTQAGEASLTITWLGTALHKSCMQDCTGLQVRAHDSRALETLYYPILCCWALRQPTV